MTYTWTATVLPRAVVTLATVVPWWFQVFGYAELVFVGCFLPVEVLRLACRIRVRSGSSTVGTSFADQLAGQGAVSRGPECGAETLPCGTSL